MHLLQHSARVIITLLLLSFAGSTFAGVIPAGLDISTSGSSTWNTFAGATINAEGYFTEGGQPSTPFDLTTVNRDYIYELNGTAPYIGTFRQTGDSLNVRAAAGAYRTLSIFGSSFITYFSTEMQNNTSVGWRLTWDMAWSMSINDQEQSTSPVASIDLSQASEAQPLLGLKLDSDEFVDENSDQTPTETDAELVTRRGVFPLTVDLQPGEHDSLASSIKLTAHSPSGFYHFATSSEFSLNLRSVEPLASVPAPLSGLLFASGVVMLLMYRHKPR